MATWYTDVALNQQQYVNFPGQPGLGTLTTQPGTQNNPLFEGPPEITATYVWTGNEVNNDIINIAILNAGIIVDASLAHVSSGVTAPAVTLTIAIGDNDLALASGLPITNAAAQATGAQTNNTPANAPLWVAATAYAAGNVVYDNAAVPTSQTFTAMAATSASTAPHSAANTVWMPNNQRYSNSIDIHAASGNVAFAGGTQLWGGPASVLPNSVVPNSVPSNLTGAQLLFQQYQIQGDCWLQAQILTSNVIAANTVSVFRVPLLTSN